MDGWGPKATILGAGSSGGGAGASRDIGNSYRPHEGWTPGVLPAMVGTPNSSQRLPTRWYGPCASYHQCSGQYGPLKDGRSVLDRDPGMAPTMLDSFV